MCRAGMVVLGLLLAPVVAWAEEPSAGGRLDWLSRPWVKSADKEAPKEDDKPEPKAGPTAREKAVAQRQKEEANLLRRDAVCTRLMQIAAETEDMELLKRAEELSERSWNLYLQRTAHLPAVPGAESPALSMRKEKP